MTKMRLSFILLMFTVASCLLMNKFFPLYSAQAQCISPDGDWHVEWHSINRTTLEFEEFLGSEKWPVTNFSHNWRSETVYGDRKDYVGFVATTTLYFGGGEYICELYNVSDSASVIVDGEKILSKTGLSRDAVKINISQGTHILIIEWQEYCCTASIGFSVGKYIEGVTQNHKPMITIGYPHDDTTVSGIVMITGEADDADGTVKAVQVQVDDDPWLMATVITPLNYSGINLWKYTWNSEEVGNGQYTIKARSHDGIEYSDIYMVTVTVDNKKDTPGFEIMSLIGGLAIALIVKKRFNF